MFTKKSVPSTIDPEDIKVTNGRTAMLKNALRQASVIGERKDKQWTPPTVRVLDEERRNGAKGKESFLPTESELDSGPS